MKHALEPPSSRTRASLLWILCPEEFETQRRVDRRGEASDGPGTGPVNAGPNDPNAARAHTALPSKA